MDQDHQNVGPFDKKFSFKAGTDVHYLPNIFKYLNSEDLWTLGNINGVYKQMINDLVIQRF